MASSSSSSQTSWQQLWEEAQPRLQSLQSSLLGQPSSPSTFRVSQLDAELLDSELVQLLQEPLTKSLALINKAFSNNFQAELTLLIQLTLYKFSVWDSGASYGARLQGLKYASWKSLGLPIRTLLLHGSLTILLPYLHSRLRAHALSQAWPDAPSSDRRRKIWELLTRLETTHSLLALLNFVAFLWNGRYRTLADRLLEMQLVPAKRLSQREVSYEFMNRQMVWHAFTEFLLFLLPLINTRALRRLGRLLSAAALPSLLPSRMTSLTRLQVSKVGPDPKRRRGKYWSLPLDQCAICHQDASRKLNLADASNTLTSLATQPYTSAAEDPPLRTENTDEEPPAYPLHTPYITSCDHVYCYVCITERMMRTADDRSGVGPGGTRWECLRCGDGVHGVDRVEMALEETDSDFGSSSLNGVDFDGYGSDDVEFTDMSGSMGSYSESGTASE
ncbi:peroxisomal biogenesis factor 2 [Cristinia sonorae]|uniref:RING-type E3 ubiquitin transferase (cysteine targeting) n=1 Tax=Cristinia sonorae TaxID=1940300 RepID=A0A8K0UW41_9AGAR|nr:peroxisomal biogenesis factor 2 [Cristinia sonorae]